MLNCLIIYYIIAKPCQYCPSYNIKDIIFVFLEIPKLFQSFDAYKKELVNKSKMIQRLINTILRFALKFEFLKLQ